MQNDYKAVINPGEMEAPHAHIFKKASNIGKLFFIGGVGFAGKAVRRNQSAPYRVALALLRQKIRPIIGGQRAGTHKGHLSGD